MMEGPGANSEEKHEPVSDIDTAVVVVGLKALDPEWPIREVRKTGFRPFRITLYAAAPAKSGTASRNTR